MPRDSLSSFGGEIGRVPLYGVTVGVGTIREHSRQAVMVAHGKSKARTVRLVAEAGGYRPEWPATILAECARPRLLLDQAAVGELIAPADGVTRQAAPRP